MATRKKTGKQDNGSKVGRPLSGKVLVTLRLEPEIIEFFRASGPGWQPRVNEVLRRSMAAQRGRARG